MPVSAYGGRPMWAGTGTHRRHHARQHPPLGPLVAALVLAAAPAPARIVGLRQRRGRVGERAHRSQDTAFPHRAPRTRMPGADASRHGRDDRAPSSRTSISLSLAARCTQGRHGGSAAAAGLRRRSVMLPAHGGRPDTGMGWIVHPRAATVAAANASGHDPDRRRRGAPSESAGRPADRSGRVGLRRRHACGCRRFHRRRRLRARACSSSSLAALVDVVEHRLPERRSSPLRRRPRRRRRVALVGSADLAARRRHRGRSSSAVPAAGAPTSFARRAWASATSRPAPCSAPRSA